MFSEINGIKANTYNNSELEGAVEVISLCPISCVCRMRFRSPATRPRTHTAFVSGLRPGPTCPGSSQVMADAFYPARCRRLTIFKCFSEAVGTILLFHTCLLGDEIIYTFQIKTTWQP